MKKRLFSVLLILILLSTALLSTSLATPNAQTPPHNAFAVVLADLNTGDIIYSHNMHTPLHPASTTKIMTAILAVEALDRGQVNINDILTTSHAALADMVPLGSNIGLEVGEEMTFESLLHAVMLVSANDASNVIAEYLGGGSIDNFVQMMNDRARQLGAMNTNFTNAHGLSNDAHLTTAYDMFLIAQHAVSNSRFVELYMEIERPHPATNMRPAGIFRTTNHLLMPENPLYNPDIFGIRTGFTTVAGFCLVSTATRGDVSLLAVVMGVHSTGGERDFAAEFGTTTNIYNWAFENLTYREILPQHTEIDRIPILLGDGADTIGLRPAHTVRALMHVDANISDNLRREVVIYSQVEDQPLEAPVAAGDALGSLTLFYGDRQFGPIPLVADQTVHLSRVAYMRSELGNTFGSIWVQLIIAVFFLLFVFYIIYAVRHSIQKRKRRRARMNRK